uniref:Uncharacterized protein n=1 Tax=Anguilla anguilla TaxID=7936 RepID=A0A0E9RPS8_ANGAN
MDMSVHLHTAESRQTDRHIGRYKCHLFTFILTELQCVCRKMET